MALSGCTTTPHVETNPTDEPATVSRVDPAAAVEVEAEPPEAEVEAEDAEAPEAEAIPEAEATPETEVTPETEEKTEAKAKTRRKAKKADRRRCYPYLPRKNGTCPKRCRSIDDCAGSRGPADFAENGWPLDCINNECVPLPPSHVQFD